MTSTIAIRAAHAEDELTLRRLAALDSARPLTGDALLAVVDEEPVAAIGLTDGRIVANPFRRTADVVDLLRLRAQRLTPAAEHRTATVGLRHRLGLAA
jgi:hypothetical protein